MEFLALMTVSILLMVIVTLGFMILHQSREIDELLYELGTAYNELHKEKNHDC
jgi:hypothetical protein